MSKNQILVDRKFLHKFAEFVTITVNELNKLQAQVANTISKEAAAANLQSEYERAVTKVAKAMYSSDFLTDDSEYHRFIKRAKTDKLYLANTLIKVCEAADVSVMGRPARVAASKSKSIDDPVYQRAFGKRRGVNELIELDDY